MKFSDQPRRAQNRARTRVRLVEALAVQLSGCSLDDVPVGSLAAAAEISEATFFNHFPTKAHLLTHFIQLWSLRVSLLARQVVAEHDSPLAALEALCAATFAETAENPELMLEIIAHQARGPHPGVESIELAERLLFLDDAEDVMELSDRGLEGVLPALLQQAVERGELPEHTDINGLLLTVASLFFGLPLLLARNHPQALVPVLQAQLQLIWAGARATGGTR